MNSQDSWIKGQHKKSILLQCNNQQRENKFKKWSHFETALSIQYLRKKSNKKIYYFSKGYICSINFWQETIIQNTWGTPANQLKKKNSQPDGEKKARDLEALHKRGYQHSW